MDLRLVDRSTSDLLEEVDTVVAATTAENIRLTLDPAGNRYRIESSLVLEDYAFQLPLGQSQTNPLETTEAIGVHPKNVVRYHATPSMGSYTWQGLDLSIIKEASYTLKDVEEARPVGDCDGNCYPNESRKIGYKVV